MSYQLVIAEKPSVARSIAGVIGANKKQDGYMEGNGYLVSWCIGHLVSLADAGAYDPRYKKWAYDDLPILPQEWQYIIPDEKKKQFDILRSLMERPDVDGLVCATDAGREGKLIFRFVYRRWRAARNHFQRLWISSMEDAAIKGGFAWGRNTMTTCINRPCAGRRPIGWWGSTRHGFSLSSTTRP